MSKYTIDVSEILLDWHRHELVDQYATTVRRKNWNSTPFLHEVDWKTWYEYYNTFTPMDKLITDYHKKWFNFDYEWNVWPEDATRNQELKDLFETTLLEYLINYEINYERQEIFFIKFKSWIQSHMPIYSQLINKMLHELFDTSTSKSNTTSHGDWTSHSVTNSNSDSHNTNVTDVGSQSRSRTGVSDTPQDELDLDLDDIDYASQVTVADSKNNTDTKSDSMGHNQSHSATDQEGTNDNTGNTTGSGRNKDLFDIVNEWAASSYNLFVDIQSKMISDGLFMSLNEATY